MNANAHLKPRRLAAGFTLLELMITVALVAVLLGLATPSFQYVINVGRITSPANELLAGLQVARAESIRRGVRTVVCRSDTPDAAGAACSTAGGAWGGWIAFVDNDNDGTLDAGEAVLRTGTVPAPAVLNASSNIANQRVVFRPDGLARTPAGALLAGRLAVCIADTTPPENVRDVTITSGSRIAVVSRNGAGACGVPANS